MTTPCLRCGHKLSAPASIDRKYSLRCYRLERAERLESAIAGYSREQRPKAKALVIAGGIKPADRDGMYLAKSSDKVTTYHCSALGCPCRSPGPCYHMAAAALFDAYRAMESGETYLKAAA